MAESKTVDLMKVVKGEATPPNCDLTLQLDVLSAEDGLARGIWTVDKKFMNGNGVSMGGFLTSAADIMMAYAVASKIAEDQTFASVDIHTTFHRPVLTGTVEVEARVERLGRKMVYVVASLFQNDKKVGDVVSSVMILAK
ncbi:PaaI family thioesterase [Sporosarcina sp. P7]|uniref:PaaI family thioesterase n=1 Tax=Sporosarcina sp. P7 TaxID=2048244 RepID=UPI000C1707F6|nr:PaaI family thioesterase [Sporosarcina sp. P7]PID23397.1 thioesterase [Sporosarcina sp. P7]